MFSVIALVLAKRSKIAINLPRKEFVNSLITEAGCRLYTHTPTNFKRALNTTNKVAYLDCLTRMVGETVAHIRRSYRCEKLRDRASVETKINFYTECTFTLRSVMPNTINTQRKVQVLDNCKKTDHSPMFSEGK